MDTSVDKELQEKWLSFVREAYSEKLDAVADEDAPQSHLRVSFAEFQKSEPDLAFDTVRAPDQLLPLFDEACREEVQERRAEEEDDEDSEDEQESDEESRADGVEGNRTGLVRLVDLDEEHTVQPGEIRSEHANRYLEVRGQVARQTSPRSYITRATFECQRCGMETEVPQPEKDTKLEEPHECRGCERQGPFRLLEGKSAFIDRRDVLVEDLPETVKVGQGEEVEAVLRGEFVDAADPGDRVRMYGVCRMHRSTDSSRAHEPYLDVQEVEIEETNYEEIDVADYEERIRAVAAGKEGDPYAILRESVAPRIYGYEMIKQAVVFQLFGGAGGWRDDGTRDRGAIHVLVLGDPGLAKTRLLGSIAEAAPRSEMASAKNATKAGLTGAVVDDGFGQEGWSVTGGALVRADKGVACIDEIDKMSDSVSASMHEAMASQQVQIHKADIHTRLPARTAVLAAGNPKYGRFDEFEPINEQIDLDPTLLSRFDLIFLEQDQQDQERDQNVGEKLVKGRKQRKVAESDSQSLSEAEHEEQEPPLSVEEVRAYIALARQEVKPVIEDEWVENTLMEAFHALRSADADEDDHGRVAVTPRKLEALHRLAEASARVRLSETIEEEDVERAKQLVIESMGQVGVDPETGEFDADIIETGESKTQRERRKELEKLIQELQDECDGGVPEERMIEEAGEKGIDAEKVRHTIENMKDEGWVYEPAGGQLRVN